MGLELLLPAICGSSDVIQLSGGSLVELNSNNRRSQGPVRLKSFKDIRVIAPFKVLVDAFNGVFELARDTIYYI